MTKRNHHAVPFREEHCPECEIQEHTHLGIHYFETEQDKADNIITHYCMCCYKTEREKLTSPQYINSSYR